jgi:N-formylglutamate amidohydrolase
MNKYFNTSYLIKVIDTGVDSNRDNHDEFKEELIRIVKDNEIKLVIDLHGADKNRDFDVEFGTLNNLSADFSTIKELENAFVSRGIINIVHNDPFKGGAITQYLFNVKDLDVIQLEINGRFRSMEHVDNLELLCNALMDFINRYIESIIREKE